MFKLARLYAIVDAAACARASRAPLDVARAFLSAGVRCIQLRAKGWDSGPFLDLARAVVDEARENSRRTVGTDNVIFTDANPLIFINNARRNCLPRIQIFVSDIFYHIVWFAQLLIVFHNGGNCKLKPAGAG